MAQRKITGVLSAFFGFHPVKSGFEGVSLQDIKKLPYEEGVAIGGLKGFAVEIGALSDAEKLELARGVAKELGLKAEDCEFPLA